MAINLSSKKIRQWKEDVDTSISTNLVGSLQQMQEISKALSQTTAVENDENNLSYRFNDLSKLSESAATQLTSFMDSFDTSLSEYISTIEKSEASTAEKVLEKIDNFAEVADKISKLKM